MPPLALVTGAPSGIGRACATHLAGLGFEVLAGIRNAPDAPPGILGGRHRPRGHREPSADPLRGRARGPVRAVAARLLPDRALDALVRRALAT